MKLVINNKERGDLIFKAIVGSHAHGTNIPESDIDIKGVYLQHPKDVIENGYVEQIEVNADEVYYELRRFVELCCTANPTMLELLFSPKDVIKYKHPVFDLLLNNKEKFLTKSCKYSFGGYAKSQISKASGLDKKMNWDKKQMERKTPLDFCYIIDGYKSYKLLDKYTQEELSTFGAAKCEHGRGIYALFHDEEGKFNFRGLVNDKSNDLRHSKIPTEWFFQYKSLDIFNIYYDRDNYSIHCKKYLEYQKWLENRNTQRYVDINEHGQKIDGKNMLHCTRLIEMGKEIAEGKGFNVRRPNAEYLITIRKGKVDLQVLLDNANAMMSEMDKLYESSSLPDKCDKQFFKKIVIKMREDYYNSKL